MRRYSAGMAILIGGLIAGTLDITYAITYSAWRGMPPQSLLQFVASGLLGQPSFDGGTPTAGLGLLLHYLMMLIIAAIFYGISRQLPFLVRKPIVWGPVFGFLVYWVMNLVVMQLSATPKQVALRAAVVRDRDSRAHVLHRVADRVGGEQGADPAVGQAGHLNAGGDSWRMSAAIQSPRPAQPDQDDFGLPGWIYHDPDFFELEKRSIFRTSWQLVCHSNDIPQVGDYHRFDLLGESVVTVRGKDGQRAASTTCAAIAPRACSTRRRVTAASSSPVHITTGVTRSKAS
jgi:hypothetical protein